MTLYKTHCKKLVKGAKGQTSGPWQEICKGLNSKKCRDAIVYLGAKGEAGLPDVKKQLGKKYDTFIERYTKEYERVTAKAGEEQKEEPPAKKKTVVVEEEPPVKKGLSDEEWSEFDELRNEVVGKQSLQALDKYLHRSSKLTLEEKSTVLEPLTDKDRGVVAKLYGQLQALSDEAKAKLRADTISRQEAKAEINEAIVDLAKKIPIEEIEALKHPIDPTVEPWDIDIGVFVPIGVGITLGRVKPITDAMEIFAIYFHGRALPELVAITSYYFLEKFEEKTAKRLSYYTSVASKLLDLQSYSILRPAAIEATRQLDIQMGLTGGEAAQLSEDIRRKIVE